MACDASMVMRSGWLGLGRVRRGPGVFDPGLSDVIPLGSGEWILE